MFIPESKIYEIIKIVCSLYISVMGHWQHVIPAEFIFHMFQHILTLIKIKKIRLFLLRLEDRRCSQLVPWDLLSDSSCLTAGPLRSPEWQQQPHSWSLEISCVTEVLAFFFLTFLRSAAASSKNAYKWTMSSKQWFGSTLYITYADPNHWKNLLRRKLVVN